MKSHVFRRCRILGMAFLAMCIGMGGIVANAALLPVGGIQSPAVSEPEPLNATRVHGGTVRFIGSGISGTLTSNVWTNDASNPFGTDRLTFTYLLTNDTASTSGLNRLTIASFAGL